MNKGFYDVEKSNRFLSKAIGCYCPHCGELSYNFPLERHSLFREPVPSRQCDFCGETAYGKFVFFVLHLVAIALLPITAMLWVIFESNIPAIIGIVLFVLTEVATILFSFLDRPRTYFTTRTNSYEFGDRIYVKTANSLRKNRFYRAGQMYEIRCSDISKDGVAIGQADTVSADCIVLRIVKNESVELCLHQKISLEPRIGHKVYGTICDKKHNAL